MAEKVFRHFLVPEACIASEGEVGKLLQEHGIVKELLPKILSTDAAAVALGAAEGVVLKFSRDSPSSGGKAAYYRVVVGPKG